MSDDGSGKTDWSDVAIQALQTLTNKGVLILLGFLVILYGAWSKVDRIEEFFINVGSAILHGG